MYDFVLFCPLLFILNMEHGHIGNGADYNKYSLRSHKEYIKDVTVLISHRSFKDKKVCVISYVYSAISQCQYMFYVYHLRLSVI